MLGRTTVLVGMLVAASAVQAQNAASPPGRYSVAPSESGFVRMDTRTGRSAHCDKIDGKWLCEPIAEVGARVEDKVDAVAGTLGLLESKFDQLAATVADMKQNRSDHAETQAVTKSGFAYTVVDRFVGMVRGLKHGDGGGS